MGRAASNFALLIVGVVLATPTSAQQAQSGVRWQPDIEGAKLLAQQTGRLVLVHFWTPECAPCMMLERNVFSQPGVAGAIEAQFVPVKLDANQNSGLAQSFGITRVPTDVVITPEGQIVGKLISPPTPSAYIAEVGQVASRYATRQGAAYSNAVAAAPQPALLNDAYAGLSMNGATSHAAAPGATSAVSTPGFEQWAPTATPGYDGRVGVAAPVAPVNAPQTAAVSPPVSYTAQLPGVDRYQSQFATSQAISSGNIGANAASYPSATSPGATVPPAPTPAVVPNQYAPMPTADARSAAPSQAQQPLQSPSSVFGAPAHSHVVAPSAGAPSVAYQAVPSNAPPALGGSTQAPPLATDANAVAPAPVATPSAAPPQAEAPVTQGDAEQLPIGFDGYCTVTMRNEWKWAEGDKQWGANHRGRLYLFVGQKEQQQFLQNPDYYAPALSGIDAVLAIEHRQTVPGLRQHSVDYDNQIYLFASEATLQQFTANPERYAAGVRQAMGIERGELVR